MLVIIASLAVTVTDPVTIVGYRVQTPSIDTSRLQDKVEQNDRSEYVLPDLLFHKAESEAKDVMVSADFLTSPILNRG